MSAEFNKGIDNYRDKVDDFLAPVLEKALRMRAPERGIEPADYHTYPAIEKIRDTARKLLVGRMVNRAYAEEWIDDTVRLGQFRHAIEDFFGPLNAKQAALAFNTIVQEIDRFVSALDMRAAGKDTPVTGMTV